MAMPGMEQTSVAVPKDTHDVFSLIAKSSSFRSFAAAFREATGLALALVSARAEAGGACAADRRDIELCRILRHEPAGRIACDRFEGRVAECAAARKCLYSKTCFAGMVETAVPVFSGGKYVATLMAGEVFRDRRKPGDWRSIIKLLGCCDQLELERIKKAYRAVPVVHRRRIQAASSLLKFFAKTLEEHIPGWLLADSPKAPASVSRAVGYIRQHAADPIHLPDVARHAGLSVQHFCDVFRTHTGLTFTQFLNRVRIENAKALLQDNAKRIAEISFACGFGSVTTFNRTFKRVDGVAPGEYRLSYLDRA
jgi:AraC-like DNA-binding protein/ligand-binding sensor protein